MKSPLAFILALTLCLSPAFGQSVADRLAALEQRVSAVEQVVGTAAPIDVPPANAIAIVDVTPISRWHAVHFKIDEATAKTLPTVQWVSDKGIERRGFNAAFTVDDGSVFICTVNGAQTSAYHVDWPAAPVAKAVPAGADLAQLRKGVYQLAGADYTISGQCDWTDVTLLGQGIEQTHVRYTGPQAVARGWMGQIAGGDRTVIRGVGFINASYTYNPKLALGKNNARREAVGFMLPGEDCTFVDVRVTGFNEGFNTNTRKSRILWERCSARDAIAYLIWNESAQSCTYDCDVDNIRVEHCIRGANWRYWAVNGCDLTNLARVDGDVNDEQKGTLVMQAGEFGYSWANKLHGPAGIGPLPITAGGQDLPTLYFVAEDLKADQGVELWGGLRYFRLGVGVKVATWYQRDTRTIADGIVPAGTVAPAWAKDIAVTKETP